MSDLSAKDDEWPEVRKPGGGLPAAVLEDRELPSADVAGEPAALVDTEGARPVKPPPPPPLVCKARECRADVRKAPMEGRARDVLVDAEASDLGGLVWRRENGDGRFVLHELGRREHVDPATRRFRLHDETCQGPDAVARREKRETAAAFAGVAAVFEAAGIPTEVVDAPPPRRPLPARRPPPPPLPPVADVVDLAARRRAKAVLEPPPMRHKCCTPGHQDVPARLYPGGTFCDPCMDSRRAHRRT